MEITRLLDRVDIHSAFLQEIATLPDIIRKPLIEWNTRLIQKKRDVCVLTQEAEQAYQRYSDALLEIKEHRLSSDVHGQTLSALYQFLVQDALLISALFASQSNQTDIVTSIAMHHWARSQTFTEEMRAKYHRIITEQRELLSFLMQNADVFQSHSGRVVVQNYTLPALPFCVVVELVCKGSDAEIHGIRLLAMQAYYSK